MTKPEKPAVNHRSFIEKCGCGRNGRYYVMQGGKQVTACNKYMRCPEVVEEGKKK